MTKQLSLYAFALILFSIIVYYVHTGIFKALADNAPIALYKVYLFNFIFSMLLCFGIILLSNIKKYGDQIGFLYLASVVLKLILFFSVFYQSIFKTEAFTNLQSANLLIPIILFLIFEVVLIRKLLNKNSHLKNEP